VKLLIGITSYGDYHAEYLERVLREYRSFGISRHVAVFTDVGRNYGADIETVVRDVSKDPCSLTWAHRQYFADRLNDYDLFLYAEDDILVTERNVLAWVDANKNLLDSEAVPGFFVRETRESDGHKNYPQAHCTFGWNTWVNDRGSRKFCYFSNVHSACCLLSRQQLSMAIRSGRYVAEPHGEPTYAMRELACSGPFVECGLTKLIDITHFDDFVVEHLTANYVGILGTPENVIREQITAMGGQTWA
jgi:hypothetical protein